MTIAFAPGQHPLLGCADVVGEALDAVTESEPIFLPVADKAGLLRQLATLEARLTELRLRVMAGGLDVAEAVGARDVAAWLSAETRQNVETPRADQQLAIALDKNYPTLRRALAEGRVNLAQAPRRSTPSQPTSTQSRRDEPRRP